MKIILKTLAAAAMLAALTSGQAAAMDLPAPMPEFRSPQELNNNAANRGGKSNHTSEESVGSDTFYTGKPYDPQAGSYLFLFRRYSPILLRWKTADPSGFPDGANNQNYAAVPTAGFDYQGLKSVLWLAALTSGVDNASYAYFAVAATLVKQQMETEDAQTGNTHFLDDGDSFHHGEFDQFNQIGSHSGYDEIYIAAHGNGLGSFWIGEILWNPADIYGTFSNVVNVQGCFYETMDTADIVLGHFREPTREFLRE